MSITAAFMLPHPPLIIPEIGKGSEGGIRRTIDAYHEAARRIGAAEPETIVLISPHQIMYTDYFHISPGKGAGGDFGRFRAGEVKTKVSYDTVIPISWRNCADWRRKRRFRQGHTANGIRNWIMERWCRCIL